MPAAVRPYVTAGVALVGAGVISVTPIEPPPVAERVSSNEYSLTAASTTMCTPGSTADPLCGSLGDPTGLTTAAVFGSGPSLLYIPINLFNAVLSIPAWELQAMDRFAQAMLDTGSWQVWSPTNVFGFDEQDPPKLQGFIDMLIPFKPFSSVLGEQLSWWARANLPMNSGCAALPGACPDLGALLDSMFKVPMSELYAGYTFPEEGEEGSTNPFTGEPVTWAGDTVTLDPWGPVKSTWDYLTAPPTGIETFTLSEAFTTITKFGRSMFQAFYPFVQNSEWYNDEQTGLAPFFRALAPLLCPSCDPENPYDNPWLYENYPPDLEDQDATTDVAALSLGAPADEDTANAAAAADTEAAAEPSDPVSAAVSGLLKKFEFAGTAKEAAAGTDEDSTEEVAETVTDGAVDVVQETPGTDEEPVDTETEDTETEDTEDTGDTETKVAEAAEDDGAAGSTGRHRKSGGFGSTVRSIKDKVDSAKKDPASGEKNNSAAGGGADTGGGDK